jgi:hypothetical protein
MEPAEISPDHISTLGTVNSLGNLYSSQGKLKEAQPVIRSGYTKYTVAELQKWTTNPDTTTSLYHNNNILFEYPIDRNTGEKISVSVVTILFVS